MDHSTAIDAIMVGRPPSLKDVTPRELSALVTLLQAFHLGQSLGQNETPPEAQHDLFQQLRILKGTLSDTARRTAVKDALVASWPKAKKSAATDIPTNSLSIKPSNERTA